MNEVTRMLSAIEQGDPKAAGDLLPMVYQELRRLAARKLAGEAPGQTLQPTALVHEAFLRLVGVQDPGWNGRGHFFAAAAEAMRRILIEGARRKKRLRHGGGDRPLSLEDMDLIGDIPSEDLLALDDALKRFAQEDPLAARLVELRYFAGLTMPEAAEALGLPLRTAERNWTYARTWLHREVARGDTPPPA